MTRYVIDGLLREHQFLCYLLVVSLFITALFTGKLAWYHLLQFMRRAQSRRRQGAH